MNILICGAGEVGRHSAEVLAASGHSITILDQSASRLAEIDEMMDVRSMLGDCVQAEVLLKAGVDKCDLLIAATNNDEVNLLSASVAKGVGCKTAIARVHRWTAGWTTPSTWASITWSARSLRPPAPSPRHCVAPAPWRLRTLRKG